MIMIVSILLALPLVSAVFIPPLNDRHDDHEHVERIALPERWHQDDIHPVHKLFKRATDDGVSYPPVGSPEWSAGYPRGLVQPDPQRMPEAWIDALNAAEAAGLIPDIPQSRSLRPQTDPVYPAGINPSGPEVCSSTAKCRNPGDIWNVPEGVFASSFDDGPYATSPKLVDFLVQNNAKTTHFMIGAHILMNPREFAHTIQSGQDLAVHTWSHPYMTTLTNLEIVAQLGWTMQLIHHSTGGRVPRYWRPPYGDSDNRVRAIAQEVFGMQTVLWTLDTNDWGLVSGHTLPDDMQRNLEDWIAGSKDNGLNILQHEITDASIDIFINVFPLIQQHGWSFGSLASVVNDRRAYQNAAHTTSDDVVPQLVHEANGAIDDVPLPSSSSPSTSGTTDVPASSTADRADRTSVGLTPTSSGSTHLVSAHPPSDEEGRAHAHSPSAWAAWLASGIFFASFVL